MNTEIRSLQLLERRSRGGGRAGADASRVGRAPSTAAPEGHAAFLGADWRRPRVARHRRGPRRRARAGGRHRRPLAGRRETTPATRRRCRRRRSQCGRHLRSARNNATTRRARAPGVSLTKPRRPARRGRAGRRERVARINGIGTAPQQQGDLTKIIRDGRIGIVIADGSFSKGVARVTQIARQNGGFVLESTSRDERSGTLTLRIPAKRFDDSMLALRALAGAARRGGRVPGHLGSGRDGRVHRPRRAARHPEGAARPAARAPARGHDLDRDPAARRSHRGRPAARSRRSRAAPLPEGPGRRGHDQGRGARARRRARGPGTEPREPEPRRLASSSPCRGSCGSSVPWSSAWAT